jgi:hypothetical protein
LLRKGPAIIIFFKGTVSQDFYPLVLSINRHHTDPKVTPKICSIQLQICGKEDESAVSETPLMQLFFFFFFLNQQ